MACQKNTNCQTVQVATGDTFMVILGDGTWSVNGLYQAAPFYNAILGPTETVTISQRPDHHGGVTDPYQVLGAGNRRRQRHRGPPGPDPELHRAGLPGLVPVDRWVGLAGVRGRVLGTGIGNRGDPLHQLEQGRHTHGPCAPPAPAAPLNSYDCPPSPPGAWLLYPGYQTVFGSYTDPVGTKVRSRPGKTTDTNLSVPYRCPRSGR